MNKVINSKKVMLMIAILAISTFIITGITSWIDYQQTKKLVENSLVNIVESEKENIEHLNKHSISKDSIISFYSNSHRNWHNIGETGDFAIAELTGDSINFLFRASKKDTLKIGKLFVKSDLATPMQNALNGKSGFMVGKDYDGNEVYAAYTYIDKFKWGIVSKINSDEIYLPFLNDLYITILLAFLLIFIGSFLFVKVTNPMINNINCLSASVK